ncbi:MAG: tetratricopeptide repeat protein, partial [Candidatus Sumerlaeia bacterium]|nr:tetratricopeptide repeat protein [Candidatus Sumerlaeia bacterium]
YLFAQGNNDLAIQELHTLAKTYYEDLGEYEQALTTLQTLKTYEPDNYNIDDFIARIYEKKGESHNAARFYWSAAQTLLQLGLENEALEKLQQVIQLAPNDESALEHLARLTALRGDKATARQYYLRLASIRREQGREDDNELIYRKLLELDDRLLEVRRNLAWLLLKRGDNLAAAEEYWRLGSQLLQTDKTTEAIESLQQCLELNPALAPAMEELLSIYQRLNKIDETISILLKASRKNVSARQFDIARQYLIRAQKLAPENPQVTESLAELYLATDATDEAINEYKRLVKIYKANNELTQAALALEKLKLLVLTDESIRKELAHLLAQINQLEKAACEWADLIELQLTRRAKQKELQALLDEAFPILYNFPDIVTNLTQRLIQSKQESPALHYLMLTASALAKENRDEPVSYT